MNPIWAISFMAMSASAIASTPTVVSPEEAVLKEKGFAVVCARGQGVFQTDDLQSELNKKLVSIKTAFSVSQPSAALALLNVNGQKTTDVGAFSVLCVTLTKKN